MSFDFVQNLDIRIYDLERGKKPISVAGFQLGSTVFGAPSAEVVDMAFQPKGNAPTVTAHTAKLAFEQAGMGPKDIDMVDLQDTCAWNEIEYFEDMGFCKPGEAPSLIKKGEPPGASQLNLDRYTR